ncbi:hypothetical protein CANMA_003169 [Candida margitis]|uniref:uncharacterized protein n=1 Tax=Candida margitis TaxID=1775924 RepID=UPI00222788EE|nr:uncharacterized protein CANMA_003169 [Candida margitis]KAI5967349.1 hypothetical protein CANMA_003169 [Candida margitis]
MFKFTTIAHINNDTTRPLVALTTRQGNRYLFGKIPEGSQRVINAIGSEVRFPKLQSIFLTGTISTWSDIGGLPGLFLTISDATKKGIKVVGDCNLLSYIVATWRQFVFRLGIDLEIVNVDQSPLVSNDEVIVKSIKIPPRNKATTTTPSSSASEKVLTQIRKLASLMFPLDTTEVNSRNPESYKSDPSSKDIHTHVQLPEASKLITQQDSISYYVEFVPIPGKFDPKRAKELGLKPGPVFKELVAGKSVVNEAGDTISPSQVVGPDRILPKVLIIDIPSEDYYQPTISSDQWHKIDNVGLVYHFIGDDVDFNMQEYQSFINQFPSNTKHLVSHRSITNNIIINEKFAVGHLKLKSIMPENFQLMNSDPFKPLTNDGKVDRLHSLQCMGIDDTGVHCDNANVLSNSNELLYKEITHSSDKEAPSFELLESRFNLDEKGPNLKDLVHISTLGTGSALPSISRNVLANLIRIPYQHNDGTIAYRSIIMDAGENTIGSMLRNFGHDSENDLKQIFSELALIHLSHLHADHHLGMISLINRWFELNSDIGSVDKKLYLIVPWQFITFVRDWYSLEHQYNQSIDLARLQMFSCEDFLKEGRLPEYKKLTIDEFEQAYDCGDIHRSIAKSSLQPLNTAAIAKMYDAIGIESISTVRALHCAWAYSSTFKFILDANHSQFFTISFSGDTRPNPKFCSIGHNSDLLIHEASLDSYWIDEAIAKKHTAMIEAVAMCQLMNCPNLLLTHFSSRYGMSNNCIPKSDLENEARELEAQLISKRTFNIFRNADLTKLKDLQIVFAYDLMNIRLGNFDKQQEKWPILQNLFEGNSKKRKLAMEDDADVHEEETT